MLVPKLRFKPDDSKIIDIDEKDIGEFSMLIEVDPDDSKTYNAFIKDIEKVIRQSLEYRNFIKYLKQELNLTRCSFLVNVNQSVDGKFNRVSVEFHHYPFTLFDIVNIVTLKEILSSSFVNRFTIADIVMKLHYELAIGLVPLSKTAHELAHSGKLFISLSQVLGKIDKFVIDYEDIIPSHLMEMLQEIIKRSNKLESPESIADLNSAFDVSIRKLNVIGRVAPNSITKKIESSTKLVKINNKEKPNE